MNPGAAIEVYKLVGWYIVISVDVGHVIIFGVIIAYGSPIGLAANVQVKVYT